MKVYLRWSLRQLYSIFFLPTRFKREFEGDKSARLKLRILRGILYLLGLLPWVITLAVLGNLFAGYTFELFGKPFDWNLSWTCVARGVTFGVIAGPAGGVVRFIALFPELNQTHPMSIGLGIAGSVAFCAIFGVARGVVISVVFSVLFGAMYGMTRGVLGDGPTFPWISVVISVAFGAAFGTAFGAAKSMSKGLGVALAFGVVLSVAIRVGWQGESVVTKVIWVAMTAIFYVGPSYCVGYFRLATYPFDVALSVAAYAAGRRRPNAAARAWRWCPVVWNEVIRLHLPFAGKLLAILAKRNREECLRQIAFVLNERKLQRRVALAAMMEITLNDLWVNSMTEMANVTDRIRWIRDAPGGALTGALAMIVPSLDRVSQHAGQYLMLHSPYRKGEALERAVDEMRAVQFHLIASSSYFPARLLRTASQWRLILDEESRKLRKLTEAAREIPNPFVFGNPVLETEYNLFSGRQDIVRQIEASVLGTLHAPTLLLHGPRRIGKTSILCQLPRLLGPDFAPAVVDCQNPAVIGSELTLLRYLSRTLREGLGIRRVYVEPLTAAALAREPFAGFDEWLDAVEQEMPNKMRVLLCLDEFERLQATLNAGWGGRFLDALRHTLQHRPRIILMFTGARTFEELGPEWTDRFISTRRVRVGFLRRKDVELLLTKPIPEFDMAYTPDALDAIIAATNCQPFLTQAVAFELVEFLNKQHRKKATREDVEVAVTNALISGGEYFANVWSEAGEQGQAIMRAVAGGRMPPASQVARTWLREHDVLADDGDFVVEMVRRWVKTNQLEYIG